MGTPRAQGPRQPGEPEFVAPTDPPVLTPEAARLLLQMIVWSNERPRSGEGDPIWANPGAMEDDQ